MANKEDARKVLEVTAAVLTRMGYISGEDAVEMSHADAKTFEKAMRKAQTAEEELKAAKKEPGFYDIVSKATSEYLDRLSR